MGDDLILSGEEYRAIFKRLIHEKKVGAPIASSLKYLETLRDWDDYTTIYSSRVNKCARCWAGKLYCYIDTNGQMYPCGDSIGVIPGVDVLSNGFQKAFHDLNVNAACRFCIVACDLEQNLMFSLNAGTILNWLRYAG